MRKEQVLRFGLTAGEMGSAGGQTLVAVLLPVMLAPHAPSTFMIGAVMATEGLFALTLPYVAGALSDSTPARFARYFGPRAALLSVTVPFLAAPLLFIGFRDSFWSLAGVAVIYFAALHMYSTPLRAQLIDATPKQRWGTVQGVMGATHLAGVTFGLVAGGLLFSVWEPLPFLVAAGLVVATGLLTLVSARQLDLGEEARRNTRDGKGSESAGNGVTARADAHGSRHASHGPAAGENEDASRLRREVGFWKELLTQAPPRRVLLANVLWNAGVEGIRPYIFLFATVVLGIAVQTASLALLAFLVAAALGSVLVGHFGDRFGRERLLLVGATLAGVSMIPGLFVRDLLPLVLLLVPAGLGAAAIVSLPYAVFEQVTPDYDVGRSTGAFYMSVGAARLVAPLLVGAAIDLGRAWLPEQEGYPVMWPIAGALILLGTLVLYLAVRAAGGRAVAGDASD